VLLKKVFFCNLFFLFIISFLKTQESFYLNIERSCGKTLRQLRPYYNKGYKEKFSKSKKSNK